MTPADLILIIGVMPALLVLSGIVSGSETALFGLNQSERAAIGKRSKASLATIQALHQKPRPLLTAILLANMCINVSYFTLSSIVVIHLEERQNHLGAAALGIGSLLAIIVFGEVIAKTTAAAHRAGFCKLVAPIWLFVIQSLWPMWSLLDRGIMGPLTRLVSSRSGEDSQIDPDELRHIIKAPGDDAHIDSDEQRLLLDVFRLGTLRARDIMMPRVELASISVDMSPQDVVEYIRKERPDQILLLDKDEAPLGFLKPARFLAARRFSKAVEPASLAEEPLFVPEQTKLDSLLGYLREKGKDRAAVVDERGELVGVVRVESIVGELIDDAGDQTSNAKVQILELGTFSVPGRMSARALLRDFDQDPAEVGALLDKVSTVAGVVLTLLGRLPDVGDCVTLQSLRLTVTELDGRAIETVLVELLQSDSEADA